MKDKRYRTKTRVDTPNHHYNRAWDTMLKYFPTLDIPGQTWLLIREGYPKTKKGWDEVSIAMIEILRIGERNSWLTLNVDGRGRIAYLCHHIQIAKV